MRESVKPIPNQRLKYEREVHNWTQEQVAEKVGTTPLNVGRWERGITSPSPHFRQKLCEIFGKSNLFSPERVDGFHQRFPIYDPGVPLSMSSLVGRDDILDKLKQDLCAKKSVALSALNGLPGVGKTALAIALAHDSEIREQFSDGVLWVGLGPSPNIPGLLGRWGTLLGISSAEMTKLTGAEAWARAIRNAIGMHKILLVIDDAWRIEDALAFKVGGHNCAHLVTTRFPEVALHFAADGARVVRELGEAEGLALLKRLAPEVVAQEQSAARALVQVVGGLPLALTLMGKYLRGHSNQPRRLRTAIERLHHVEERLWLTEPRAVVEHPPGLAPGTPISLQAVIETSARQLEQEVRTVLYALSIFPAKPNSFSEEAAQAICAAPVEMLDTLTDAGLLEDSGPGRYTLHQTIADYARTRRSDAAVEERMASYFASYLETFKTDYNMLEQETDNACVALQIAFDRRMSVALMQGANSFAYFLRTRGLYTLAEMHLQRAVDAARALDNRIGLATALLHLGRIAISRGNHFQSEAYLQEGLVEARRVRSYETASSLLQALGKVAEHAGNYNSAAAYLLEGLAFAHQVGDGSKISGFLAMLGGIDRLRGNYNQAESYLREGLKLARQLELYGTICSILTTLSAVENSRGSYKQAELYLEEGLTLARQHGLRGTICSLLVIQAVVSNSRGYHVQANRHLQEGLALANQLGLLEFKLRERIVSQLLKLSVAVRLRPYEQAKAYLQEDLELVSQFRHRELIIVLFTNLSIVESEQKQYVQAEEHLQAALDLARVVGNRQLIGEVLCAWGEFHLQLQQLQLASAAVQDALKIAPEEGQELVATAQYSLARVLAAQGNNDEASRQAQASLAIFQAIGHRRTSQVRRWLKTLSERL